MFKFIVEILLDLIPHKDLPNSVWLSRFIVLFLSLLIIIYGTFLIVDETEIAKNYGFRKIEKTIALNQVGFTLLVRNIRVNLRELSSRITPIKTILVISSYNTSTGLFTLNHEPKGRYIVWEFAAPQNLNLSVTNLEFYLRDNNSQLGKFETNACTVETLSPETIKLLRSARLNNADSWAICPIFEVKEKALMAYTIAFFSSKELAESNTSFEELEANIRNLNGAIADSYSYFSTVVKQ